MNGKGHHAPGRGTYAADTHIVNLSRGTSIADHVEIASSFWRRAFGLMGCHGLPNGYGLIIRPANSIHTFFVFTALDLLYLDRDNRVLRIVSDLKPWRVGPVVRRSKWVLELPAGTVARTAMQPGDIIAVQAAASPR